MSETTPPGHEIEHFRMILNVCGYVCVCVCVCVRGRETENVYDKDV